MARRVVVSTSGRDTSNNSVRPNAISVAASASLLAGSGNRSGSFIRSVRSVIHATSIACLLPNSAYRSRFDTRARRAMSSVLVPP